ncbi:MAG: type II secretion system protein N [Bilophila wadsworthia]
MSRRLTTLFSLFCIALIAWFLARATFALRETALETSGSASRLAENAAAAPEPLAAFDGITTRNLLGVSVFPPEAHRSLKSGTDADSGEENGLLSADGIDALPVSKQGWKLLGTIVNTGSGKASRAVIQVNGAEQPYREGDTIQGWKIALVQRRTVVVAKGGSKERLLMSEDPILQKEDTKPDEQKTVSRARLREELGDVGSLMRAVSVSADRGRLSITHPRHAVGKLHRGARTQERRPSAGGQRQAPERIRRSGRARRFGRQERHHARSLAQREKNHHPV